MSKGRNERTAAKRVVQEQLARERRRKRTLLTSGLAIVVLVAAGLIGWGVMASQSSDAAAGLTTPTVAVDDGTGFAVGTGKVKVDIYEDFMCPICGQFEKDTGATLAQLAADGTVTVVYHPIAILDRYSSTEYSTRSAAASAAAAEGGKFMEFHNALFDNQPAEGSAGLSDARLIELGRAAGLSDTFATGVTDRTYRDWATKATDTAASRGVTGTPTIMINGVKLEKPDRLPTAAEITAAVEAAAA